MRAGARYLTRNDRNRRSRFSIGFNGPPLARTSRQRAPGCATWSRWCLRPRARMRQAPGRPVRFETTPTVRRWRRVPGRNWAHFAPVRRQAEDDRRVDLHRLGDQRCGGVDQCLEIGVLQRLHPELDDIGVVTATRGRAAGAREVGHVAHGCRIQGLAARVDLA